jgi:hypothetical protein
LVLVILALVFGRDAGVKELLGKGGVTGKIVLVSGS